MKKRHPKKKVITPHNVLSSYKDPAGFVFTQDGEIYREIAFVYKKNYDFLLKCGLYKYLRDKKNLITHEDVTPFFKSNSTYKIIKPVKIPFISYPYEWSFSQLKDASLLTLKIQKHAISHGMSLKDASPYNIQFLDGNPIFIDTLSFEIYTEGKPWVAYKQFCEQFLAPLSLMAYKDIRLSALLRTYIEGIPLDLAVKLLPLRSRINSSIFIHLFLHSKSQKKFSHGSTSKTVKQNFNKKSFIQLVDSLTDAIESLKWKSDKTVWGNYYDFDHPSYSDKSLSEKSEFIEKCLEKISTKLVWDLGANTGKFSRISSQRGIETISIDFDPLAVELNYLHIKKTGEKKILPLCVDLMNPSPSLGWANKERDSLLDRPHPDTIFALALIHHLCIANNLPLSMIAKTMSEAAQYVIMEFVPKDDPQTQVLLSTREDIFPNYTQQCFEKEFNNYFYILEKKLLSKSSRTMYLLKKKSK